MAAQSYFLAILFLVYYLFLTKK